MTGPTPAIGRLALAVVAITVAGCAGSPLDLVDQWMGVAPAAGDANAQAPAAGGPTALQHTDAGGTANGHAADGNGGFSAVDSAAEPAPSPRTELAMAPMPARPHAPRKPETSRAICGALAPGARAMGAVESDGQQFLVECFRAKTPGAGPATLILHGSRGIGRNTIYERIAEQLAERGHNAFIFQYKRAVDPPPVVLTGKSQAPKPQPARLKTPPPRKRDLDTDGQIRAIDSAITAMQALSYVDHERIGMFGLSLGGFHALAIASRDRRIGAVVDMFGAMPRPVEATVERMPPTLVLHGDRDAVVPVKRAHELARLLKAVGAEHEVKIYKGQGHSFTGAADQDSVERTVNFLERWLAAPPRPAG